MYVMKWSYDILMIAKRGKPEESGLTNHHIDHQIMEKSYDCNNAELVNCKYSLFCFPSTKHTFLPCQDVFSLQIGGDDPGSTFSSSRGSLFLCQRTWRIGKKCRLLAKRSNSQLTLISLYKLN